MSFSLLMKNIKILSSKFFKSEFVKGKRKCLFLFQKEKEREEVLDFVFQMGGMVLLVEGGLKLCGNF
jgi:diaminohydroxyphosphoribosylaminopyrimidine deaminase/5-amino-6-(5-phosphoribosylamino)uracil reductase